MGWSELIRNIRISSIWPIAWKMAWVEFWEWCSKGLQSNVSCEFEVHWKPEATYILQMKTQYSSTFRCTGVSSANVIWFVITDRALHICQSHFAITQSRWYWSTYVWVWDTARLFVAKQELLYPYNRWSGAPELQPLASKCCCYATNILTQVLNIA